MAKNYIQNIGTQINTSSERVAINNAEGWHTYCTLSFTVDGYFDVGSMSDDFNKFLESYLEKVEDTKKQNEENLKYRQKLEKNIKSKKRSRNAIADLEVG